jgi:hypothetical protein
MTAHAQRKPLSRYNIYSLQPHSTVTIATLEVCSEGSVSRQPPLTDVVLADALPSSRPVDVAIWYDVTGSCGSNEAVQDTCPDAVRVGVGVRWPGGGGLGGGGQVHGSA